MTESREIADFRSDRFVPVLPDTSQVNPGVYGAELAYWLCTELAQRDVVTSYPQSEDWGWYLEYFTESGGEFTIDCVNVGGTDDHWQLRIRRYGRKLFGRDRPPFSEVERLLVQLKAVLESEPSISDLTWQF